MQHRSFYYYHRIPNTTGGYFFLALSRYIRMRMRRHGRSVFFSRGTGCGAHPRGGLLVFPPSVGMHDTLPIAGAGAPTATSDIAIQGRMTPHSVLAFVLRAENFGLGVRPMRALPLRWARCMTQVVSAKPQRGKTAQRSLLCHRSDASYTPPSMIIFCPPHRS